MQKTNCNTSPINMQNKNFTKSIIAIHGYNTNEQAPQAPQVGIQAVP